jgi:hypothetical protein
MTENLGQRVAATLRVAAQAYAAGDQTAPCAVLWPDPERLWESVIPELQTLLPELFALGAYAPEVRTGPALWLRCIEARLIEGAAQEGTVPIFYLPGISREKLRAVEDCPAEITPLVELQFRGVVWLHVNGREWTPYAFLVSKHGGLELDVARDQATIDALAGALPRFVSEPLSHYVHRRLDAEYFNGLLAPDATGLLLEWLSDPAAFQKAHAEVEWRAFCEQCRTDFRFDPIKDGPLKAARLLAERGASWMKVWQRFADFPAKYPGIVDWLRRAAPTAPKMFDTAEVWPDLNDAEERKLQQALETLVDKPQDEAIRRVAELETQHGARRGYPWHSLGLSSLASVLEPLARLAALCENAAGAPNPEAHADFYACEGWRVDAAALATMAACGSLEQHGAVLDTLRAIYQPWLETTSRHLQNLITDNGQTVARRNKPMEPAAGRLVLFADGLRMDLAHQLADRLAAAGVECARGWDWSSIPTVTATAKPAASPAANALSGGEAGDDFSPRLASTNQVLTHPHFVRALKGLGWQVLAPGETGEPAGSAWTEAGAIDQRGHSEGWKLARSVDSEVRDLVHRIIALRDAGWSEIIVVTDHGWLLMPRGLPKVELKAYLTESRWGRCAALKPGVQADVQTFKWHWNPDVVIACPRGVGCYRASMEYSHGGVSLQEMVTPVLRVMGTGATAGTVRLVTAKWTGAKCRITVRGESAGARLDIRSILMDPSTSLLADRASREITAEGTVTAFLEDDADIGKNAHIVLLDQNGQVIDSMATTLGESGT